MVLGPSYGSIPDHKHHPIRSSGVGKLLALSSALIFALTVAMTISLSTVVLDDDDDYKETQKVYPLESSENYPPGEWSGDTGAEPSDQYPEDSTADDPPGEWSGDTGSEPSDQYPSESTMEIPDGEWSGDTGSEKSDQYPVNSSLPDVPKGADVLDD